MGWKNLTFILIPHSQSKIKQVKIHRNILFAVIFFLVASIGTMIFYIIGFQSKSFYYSDIKELNKQNKLLESVVTEFDSSLATMSAKVDSIEGYTEKIRKEYQISEKDLKIGNIADNKKSPGSRKISTSRLLTFIDRMEKRSYAFEQNFNSLFSKCMTNEDFLRRVPSIRPAKGFISKEFNYNKRTGIPSLDSEINTGINITNSEGTPIVATADGYVTDVSFSDDFGRFIVIDHQNGYKTRYTHLLYQRGIAVKPGDKVSRGQIVGYMGRTGMKAMDPHVMYSIEYHGAYVDPSNYFLFQDSADAASKETQTEQN